MRIAIVSLLGLFLVLSVVAAYLNVYRPHRPIVSSPARLGLAHRPVHIQTSDGLLLSGWFVAAKTPHPRGAILICHGVGANRDDVLPRARFLAEAGYTSLSFDFRGHGASAGNKTSLGMHEVHDVRAALDALTKEAPGLPLAILAQSMGAATAVMAAKSVPEVTAYVLDSSFASLWEMVRVNFRAFPPVLAVALQYTVSLWGSIMVGGLITSVEPQAAIRDLAPRPVLFIHGGADDFIPVEHSIRLHRLYDGPKELWIVPGARHVQSHAVAGVVFERRVLDFLERSLHRTVPSALPTPTAGVPAQPGVKPRP